jgi:hypothetical protein
MARPRNDLSTVPITISTTPHVVGYLQTLVGTGLYGKNNAEAAERLIAQTIGAALGDDARAGLLKQTLAKMRRKGTIAGPGGKQSARKRKSGA